MFIGIFLAGTASASEFSSSNDPITESTEKEAIYLNQIITWNISDQPLQQPTFQYFQTSQADYTPGDLLQNPGIHWKTADTSSANFGYSEEAFWFRLQLKNATDEPQQRLLVVRAPHLDEVHFWEFDRTRQLRENLSGELYPFNSREQNHPMYLYTVEIPAKSARQYIFRIGSEGSVSFPLQIWKPQSFYLQDDMEAVGHGLYAGFLLFVIIFNFFIFIALRESMYFHYMLLTSMILLIQASLSGRTFQLIWPDLPDLQNLSILVAVPLSAFALTEFSRRFLETRLYAPRANRLLNSISIISLGCLTLSFFLPPHIAKQLSVIGALAAVLAVSIVSPYLWYKGIRQARLFSCAWTGLQIGALTTLLYNLGLIPHSLLTVNALEIGSALQAALISLAIVERVYQERDHRLKVQQQVIEEQRELQRMEQRNLYDATHHPVTELPNRGYLERFIKERIGIVGNKSLSLCLISLNRYREIDRTMGQDNADQLLYQIAHQLNDFVSPLPGVTALETITGIRIHVASVDDITLALVFDSVSPKEQEVLMMAISGYLLQRIDFGNLSLDLDPRFGLARYPEHGQTPQSLLRMAKIALDATQHIQGCVAEYCDDFNPYSERRLTLMAELAKAIENNNLVLNFQPQLSLKTGKITSFEGLVRWHHDRFGHVSPDEFIYLAEESGIIHQLTLWVMENALGKLQALQTSGFNDVGIAINISAVDLEMPHFVEEVKEKLANYDVNARLLTLELTETALMRTPDLALQTLKELSELGFSIALDDFGAGYSSLSYIQRLPLHKIKIDRSLGQNIERCQENYVIAKTAIDMCHGLGYEVVMEGVEELATLEVLKVLGADQIQGFWLARPMLWDFAREWLRTFVADGIRLPEPSTPPQMPAKSAGSVTDHSA